MGFQLLEGQFFDYLKPHQSVDSLWGMTRGGGATFEWPTTSPLPRNNFDELSSDGKLMNAPSIDYGDGEGVSLIGNSRVIQSSHNIGRCVNYSGSAI